MIKNYLKSNKFIVKVYEFIFAPLHDHKDRCAAKKRIHMNYGDKNRNIKFLVIWNESGSLVGPFSFILFKLGAFKYASKHGFIPVIDFKNHYAEIFQDEKDKGSTNAWEYYFEQPVPGFSLDDVYESRNVFLYDKEAFNIPKYDTGIKLLYSPKELGSWSKIMNKYVRPNSAIRERIAKEYSMFGTDKILGVAVRAEMYWGSITGNKGVKGHSKVPGVEELIRIVEKKLEEWNYDSIFFMTEDRSYHDIMSDHFGSRFHSVTRPLLNYFIDGQPVMDLKVIKREFENYSIQSKIEDYITEVYLLSMCDSVYATVEGGTVCAGIINGGKYLHAEYYDRGDIT